MLRGPAFPLFDDVFAVAVSGGSDSIALLQLALESHPRELIRALTVDHGLRIGSRQEAEQVAAWCVGLGVKHHILTWTGEKPSTGIQAKAREARYDLMASWCIVNGVGVLLTGHTQDDQAETVAMRKLRTRSVRSLAGIWPETEWKGVKVVRPLLEHRREELRDMLLKRGVAWIDDPSNVNPRFERVRVRQALVGADGAGLARVALASQKASRALDAAVQIFISAHVRWDDFGLIWIERQAFETCEVAMEVLAHCIAMAGSGERPEPAAVVRLMKKSSRATLGGAVVVWRKSHILVGREPGRIEVKAAQIPACGRVLWDGRFWISGPPGGNVRPAGATCPRPAKSIPAFVLAGLPLVETGNDAVLPHLVPHSEVSVALSERFWA